MDVAVSLAFQWGWEGLRSAAGDWAGDWASSGARLTSVADKPHSPPASQGETPLHWAAGGGSTATAEALMARGADVNAKDVSGRGREPWPRMGGQAAGQNHVRQQATRGGAAE